jgi:hypothetical protein
LTPPRIFSALPPYGSIKASPKAISRRTSYLRVRLEFLPYPQLIATLFNGCAFGPPKPFTVPSSWPWVDHPVSGLQSMTRALLRLAFASDRLLNSFSMPRFATRRTVLQKVRGRASSCCASAGRKHRVSGSLSLPSRGSFHLSLTVLCAIGHRVVFSLGGWSPRLPTRFPVSRGTPDPAFDLPLAPTRLSRSSAGFPKTVPVRSRSLLAVHYPGMHASRFGLLRVRSPLLTESLLFSLPLPT